MPVPSTAPLVSRLIPGGLEKFLREARDRRESYLTISDRLLAEHDITVSPQTVTNWCALYNIVDPPRPPESPEASTKGLPKKVVT